MVDSDDSDNDEPNKVSKLSHSDLLFLYHGVNGGYERLKQRHSILELEKNSLIETIEMINSRSEKDQSLEEEIDKAKEKIGTLKN